MVEFPPPIDRPEQTRIHRYYFHGGIVQINWEEVALNDFHFIGNPTIASRIIFPEMLMRIDSGSRILDS